MTDMVGTCARRVPMGVRKGLPRKTKPCGKPVAEGKSICADHLKWGRKARAEKYRRVARREPMSRAPTKRQLEILRFIASRFLVPTMRELTEAFQLGSTNAAHDHIGALIRKGLLDKLDTKARALWVTDKGREALREGSSEHPADVE